MARSAFPDGFFMAMWSYEKTVVILGGIKWHWCEAAPSCP